MYFTVNKSVSSISLPGSDTFCKQATENLVEKRTDILAKSLI